MLTLVWCRINYGMLGNVEGTAIYQVPLALQAVPALYVLEFKIPLVDSELSKFIY